MSKAEKSTSENQSVARALGVLNLLAATATPLGVREIARQLQVAPSIAQRLVRTLANAGYLEQTGEASRYTIGYRAFQVGNAFVSQNSIHSAVMPELYALADQYLTGFLGVLRGRTAVYLATVQSNGPIALTHRPGSQTPLHSTALGKALLSEMSDAEVKNLFAGSSLPRLTSRTRTTIPQLLADLNEVRQHGYAVSDGENRNGVYSVGAVVRDLDNHAVAAVSGAVPSAGLTQKERERVIKLVTNAAKNVSRKLGAPVDDGRRQAAEKKSGVRGKLSAAEPARRRQINHFHDK